MHFKQAWAKHRRAYNTDQSCITRKEEGLPKPCISLPRLHLLWSTYKAPRMLHHLNELAKQTPGIQRFDLAGLASSKPKLSAPLPWVQSPSSWLCTGLKHLPAKGTFFVRISSQPQCWQVLSLSRPAPSPTLRAPLCSSLCTAGWIHPTAWEPRSCSQHSCKHSRPHK